MDKSADFASRLLRFLFIVAKSNNTVDATRRKKTHQEILTITGQNKGQLKTESLHD